LTAKAVSLSCQLCCDAAWARSSRPSPPGDQSSPIDQRRKGKATMSTAKTTAKVENLKPVEAAVAAHKETVDAVMKAGTDVATKHYENVMSMSKDQLEKFSGLMFRNVDDMASLNKDN